MKEFDLPPLVVDVDRTLIATDLLWEGILRVIVERPHRLPYVLAGLLRGRSGFKGRVAEVARLDLERMPLNRDVQRLMREARAAGRSVVLASAGHRSQVEELARRVGADRILCTEGRANLKGHRKLEAVHDLFDAFDYVGDSAADLPMFRAARRGYLVSPGWLTRLRIATGNGMPEVLNRGDFCDAWTRALRPHHWAKNALLLLPILAAHLSWSWALSGDVVAGLASFSLLASAVYIGNDLVDLPADRGHPTKRTRPLATGELSIPAGIATALLLVAASALLALRLPWTFAAVLGAYLVLNLGYSVGLKRVAVLDVVVLAALYTSRVVAGAALAEIALTEWFLAFAIFFFLSLAVMKRVIELERHYRISGSGAPGRSYQARDLAVLWPVGAASGVMSALVYCLYITGPVRQQYGNPQLLWIGLPLLLYWMVRAWLLAVRGEVDEDPVAFVLRDPPSYAVFGLFVLVVWVAG